MNIRSYSEEKSPNRMDKNKPCKYYKAPTYATCSICAVECKYTSCYGFESNCKYKNGASVW